ncbi:hypothetical protein [Streptomyces sp. NPDC048057]|uniref:hypothetical protein n=1 Tax=Streptomyces sp. NPDC048057 TaxID=3155628 RepID=UPI0033DAA531
MHDDRRINRAIDVLVSLADPDDAERVRERIGVEQQSRAVPPGRWSAVREIAVASLPASAPLWMLEQDDPLLNELVLLAGVLPGALQVAVIDGESFGPGRHGPVPRTTDVLSREYPQRPDPIPRERLVPELRAVTTMGRGHRIARWIPREDWQRVVEADVEQALPGYARWALALRPDCPATLRERFASHPRYAHRMRTAGIMDGPGVHATTHRPALAALSALDTGRWAFPSRMPDAEAALRPLVLGSLGANVEAWAVLAQLLPTFTGTVPELVVTSGAIA